MARRRTTVEGTLGVRDERARPKWAFVGGLKEESRIWIVELFDVRPVGLRIWKSLLERMKDWRWVEYVREDMLTRTRAS